MRKRSIHHSGFTIIELMLALVMLATLMAAVAVAFDATVKNYHANEAIYKTVSTARAALLRITNDVRTAQTVAVIGAGGDPDNSQCSLDHSNGSDITYRYDAGAGILYLVTNDDGTDPDYVLCRNVTAMTFNRSFVPGQPDLIRSVRISMTVTDDDGQLPQTLTAAAVVRRNL